MVVVFRTPKTTIGVSVFISTLGILHNYSFYVKEVIWMEILRKNSTYHTIKAAIKLLLAPVLCPWYISSCLLCLIMNSSFLIEIPAFKKCQHIWAIYMIMLRLIGNYFVRKKLLMACRSSCRQPYLLREPALTHSPLGTRSRLCYFLCRQQVEVVVDPTGKTGWHTAAPRLQTVSAFECPRSRQH